MRKKIMVRAPALTRTGYGEHARYVLRALRQVEDQYDIYLFPVNWGHSNWIWEDSEERKWLDSLIQKAVAYQQHTQTQKQPMQFDASIQITIPNEWERIAPINIGITAGIETTKVAPVWLEKSNLMDKIIVPSVHSQTILVKTHYEGVDRNTGQKAYLKCERPVDVIPYPVKSYPDAKIDLKLNTKFNFLSVAQWGPRKNIKNTIRWFVEEFIDNPDVGLVVKMFAKGGSIIDRYAIEAKVDALLSKYSHRQCKVYLLHGDMTEEEMHALYSHPQIKAFVSLSHGEGYGLPHFEAAYSGLPIIAPKWSGYLDFLRRPIVDKKGHSKMKSCFATVDYELKPVQEEARWEGVIEADSAWCFAEQGSYKMRLREMHKDWGRFKKQASDLQKWIWENFKEEDKLQEIATIVGEVVGNSVTDREVDDLFNDLFTNEAPTKARHVG